MPVCRQGNCERANEPAGAHSEWCKMALPNDTAGDEPRGVLIDGVVASESDDAVTSLHKCRHLLLQNLRHPGVGVQQGDRFAGPARDLQDQLFVGSSSLQARCNQVGT